MTPSMTAPWSPLIDREFSPGRIQETVQIRYYMQMIMSVFDDNCTPSTEKKPITGPSVLLTDLPSEIFLHICSFLQAKFVIKVLSQVCRTFQSIIKDDGFWMVRIKKRWPKTYPAVPIEEDVFNWIEACLSREEQYLMWRNNAQQMEHFVYTEGMYASVDSVHLMQGGKLLAVGSRDRYLHLLDLTKLQRGSPESVKDTKRISLMDAHKGWIWTIKSQDQILSTGAWDRCIKLWDIAVDCKCLHRIKLKSAVLCSHFEPGFLAAGSFDKKVYHCDPRVGAVVSEKRYHKQPVLCMAADRNYIITGSEDKYIHIFDRRADSIFKSILFPSYPLSLSYADNQLWVGDKNGQIHLVDATQSRYSLVDTYDSGHSGKVTGVQHTQGALFTCSTDRTIKAFHPTIEPDLISTFSSQTAEVASIDFQNNILASANSNVSVGIWIPKESNFEQDGEHGARP